MSRSQKMLRKPDENSPDLFKIKVNNLKTTWYV